MIPAAWARAMGATALCLALLLAAGEALVAAALPAVRATVPAWTPEFEVLKLDVGHVGPDRALRVEVTLAHAVVLGGRVLMPSAQGWAQASTLALQGLQGPLVALWAVLALGTMPWRVRLLALALLLPAAAGLAVIDMSLALAAALWGLMVDNMAPGSFSPLQALQRFMASGGRLALGASMGLAALGLARSAPRWRRDSGTQRGSVAIGP